MLPRGSATELRWKRPLRRIGQLLADRYLWSLYFPVDLVHDFRKDGMLSLQLQGPLKWDWLRVQAMKLRGCVTGDENATFKKAAARQPAGVAVALLLCSALATRVRPY